eukprot:TRINITY_DN11203_c0_g1_i11.p2 TRINITY_DN11203_c0_g1~~TRINITY_DN11203_c0_g1_i11.p2  ORF type:complete len:108 (+),score=36.57 TRINITY_DN11203_c0_g1_i11:559-882(+)
MYRNFGVFYFDERYDLNDWLTMSTCSTAKLNLGVFNCQENGVSMYMVISDMAILLLAPEEKRKNFCALKLWATFYSLAKLERDIDMPSKVVLHWQQKGKAVRVEGRE